MVAQTAQPAQRGIQTIRLAIVINVALVAIKITAGVLGHAYALIADGIESGADIVSSAAVWTGLRIAARPPDENHPFGHGKAEALAGAAVSLMLVGAAAWVAGIAVRLIQTPHQLPALFTLAIAGIVIVIKESLYRRSTRVADQVGGSVMRADAWHHRSDAISSLAAFIGISVARVGHAWIGGPGWEKADDWAALVAAVVIVVNGCRALMTAVGDLMDTSPDPAFVDRLARAARDVPGIRYVEKLAVRRSGFDYYVDIHAQAEPTITLYEAHELSGLVKAAIKGAAPNVCGVLVHMEPFVDNRSERHASRRGNPGDTATENGAGAQADRQRQDSPGDHRQPRT